MVVPYRTLRAPAELLAIMPPMVARLAVEISGAKRRPWGASRALSSSSTMPGSDLVGIQDILAMARKHHAERPDLIHAGVAGGQGPGDFVEADFAGDGPLEVAPEGGDLRC